MLREIVHFVRHLPEVARLSRRLDQAELYDTLMRRAEAVGFAARRAELVGDLEGDVLEIGAGTGLMFPHYRSGVRVAAIEPDARFARLAAASRRQATVPVHLISARAERLPFADARFDAVVCSMVLCSVRSVPSVLAEIRRVLRPGGVLRLIEHVISERTVGAVLMHLGNPLWRILNGQGCNLNRRVEARLGAAGFTTTAVESFQMFAPGLPAFPMKCIRALRAADVVGL